ncbi:hypothetical protein ERY13_20850 [Paenibacillus mucilaginosus]|nr:hypothetical protein ERY13_20850 [Paenibacillus mucilaginosus]
MTAILREDDGCTVSSKTVSRLMKEMGLKSITVGKYKATTNSKHNMPVHDNILNRQFKVDAPNKVWVTDYLCRHWRRLVISSQCDGLIFT